MLTNPFEVAKSRFFLLIAFSFLTPLVFNVLMWTISS